MKLGIVALVGLLWFGACDKNKAPAAKDWKERSGPGFTVQSPLPHEMMSAPPGTPVKMTIYSYLNKVTEAWQVQIADMPEELPPEQILANMTAHLRGKGEIKSETDVTMGDGAKDFRYVSDMPQIGRMYVRVRVVIKNHKAYQIMVLHRPEDTGRDADADRFVDSFKLTN